MSDMPTNTTGRKRKKPIIGLRASVESQDGPIAVEFHADGRHDRDFPCVTINLPGDADVVIDAEGFDGTLTFSAWSPESDALVWVQFDRWQAKALLTALLDVVLDDPRSAQYNLGAKAVRAWEEADDAR